MPDDRNYTLGESGKLSPEYGQNARGEASPPKIDSRNSAMVTKPPAPAPAPKGPLRNDVARMTHNEALKKEGQVETARQKLARDVAADLKARKNSPEHIKSKEKGDHEK